MQLQNKLSDLNVTQSFGYIELYWSYYSPHKRQITDFNLENIVANKQPSLHPRKKLKVTN